MEQTRRKDGTEMRLGLLPELFSRLQPSACCLIQTFPISKPS
jgi:hypothetical protein